MAYLKPGTHVGPYITRLPDPRDHPVFRVAP